MQQSIHYTYVAKCDFAATESDMLSFKEGTNRRKSILHNE